MASQTAICNRALELLGQQPIVALSSSVPAAKALRRVFTESRRATLEMHPWNFAKKRIGLAASATAPVYGFARGFPLPSDFVKLLQVENEPRFELEADPAGSQWICTDAAAPLNILYIYDITDTGRYTPSFVKAFAAQLAFDACEDVTGSNTKKQAAADALRLALLEAFKSNGLQRQAVGFKQFSFLRSRSSGANSFWPPLGRYRRASVMRRVGTKLIATLPPGEWRLILFQGRVIAVCPDHPPRIIG
jgi:hypothetical protein